MMTACQHQMKDRNRECVFTIKNLVSQGVYVDILGSLLPHHSRLVVLIPAFSNMNQTFYHVSSTYSFIVRQLRQMRGWVLCHHTGGIFKPQKVCLVKHA